MGLDPDDDTYEAGNDCTHCHATLFNNVTPEFVQVLIFGVINCPPAVFPLPNGTFLLPQVLPCHWSVDWQGYTMAWTLEANQSHFVVGAPNNWFFVSNPMAACRDFFKNEIVICVPDYTLGRFGEAHVFWGPGIPIICP